MAKWNDDNGAIGADAWTSEERGFRRLRVDVGQTGFWEGREFRLSLPLSIPAGTPTVIKFSSPVDFVLQTQTLTADAEGILFEAYGASQGVESGVFTPANVLPNNGTSTTPAYTRQATVTTGGAFVPNGGEEPREVIRLRVNNATAQRSTVGGVVSGERGLPAGDYYLVFDNLTNNGTATGVYFLIWEERP